MKKLVIYVLATSVVFVNITFAAASRYLVANGNWSSTTCWSSSSGGASGSSVPGTNDRVIIEGGFTVTLTSDVTSNNLELKNGNIATDVYTLTIGTGTLSTGTLTYTSGAVIGNLKRWIGLLSTSILFPVGTADYNRQATIHNLSISLGGTITSSFIASDPGEAGLPLMDGGTNIVNCAADGFWHFTTGDGLTLSTGYSLDLTAAGFSGIVSVNTVRILRRTNGGSNWTLDGNHSQGTGTTDIPIAHRTNLSGLTEFGIGSSSDNPLPVNFVNFYSTVFNSAVKLKWETSFELNNAGFEIQRTLNDIINGWESVSFVNGSGTINTPVVYEYFDRNLVNGIYYYRIKQMDFNGAFNVMYMNGFAEINSSPNNFTLLQNYPNPFNPTTNIRYYIAKNSYVKLTVYNLLGKEIRTLVNEKLNGGYYEVKFEAMDLSSGIYFYKIVADGFSETKFMLLQK